MKIDIRLPNINGKTDSEQLAQIKSYLYQFAGQLQWAMNTLETGNSNVAEQSAKQSAAKSTSENASPASTFNQIKSLIIKSADIVNAYYDEITTLINKNNLYEAYSDFGTFVEKTNNTLYGDGSGLTQSIENIQQIFDENGNIKAERLVNGNIFSGVLKYAYDGEAIVGIRVGQTTQITNVETGETEETFKAYAEFTANRLSFFDSNGTEVAWISDKKLYITNIQVTGSFTMSSFVDTVLADGSIVTKWLKQKVGA